MKMLRSFPFASRGTIRVVINTMSVHREGVEPNSVDGPDHHHDHIAHSFSSHTQQRPICEPPSHSSMEPLLPPPLGSGRGELVVCCWLGCVNGKRYFLLSS